MSSKTTSQTAIFNRRESEARSYCRGIDRLFVSARGSEMTDAEGHSYIDFLAGCSSLNYGHNDPDMKHALIEHLTDDGLAHALDLQGDKGMLVHDLLVADAHLADIHDDGWFHF